MKVGSQRINPVQYRKNIAYVMQDDSLMQTATPREALMFSANMRLPPNTPRAELVATVDRLLEDLGIMECADVLIGGPLIKGISGGQRKRTSVGVEVITDPTVSLLPCLKNAFFKTKFPLFLCSSCSSWTSLPRDWTHTLPRTSSTYSR